MSMVALTGSAEASTHLKRWKTSNGYTCVKHTRAVKVKRHRGHKMWPKVGKRARTICMKRTHVKRHRSSGGGSTAWVLPRYVVMCESGGNPRAVNLTPAGLANGTPSGLYQITRPTWLAYGGGRFASEARFATVYEQGVIAKRVLAGQGPRAWACW